MDGAGDAGQTSGYCWVTTRKLEQPRHMWVVCTIDGILAACSALPPPILTPCPLALPPAHPSQKLKKNQKVLVVCAIGGTLDTFVSYRREKKMFEDPERTFGRESRSLKAVYELLEVCAWG